MRLIDADELKKKLRCIEFGEMGRKSSKLENWVVNELDINSMPTIEISKTISARWERSAPGQKTLYYCSNCNFDGLGAGSAYCPYCGAKMY